MSMFKWGKVYMTHIEGIDEQHKMLVDMINNLGEELNKKGRLSDAEMADYFKQVATYTKIHFKDEEAYMYAAKVDPRHTQIHKQSHNDFLSNATKLYHEIKNNNVGQEMLFHLLSNWLFIHILGTDKILVKQANMIKAGKSPAEAFELTEKQTNENIGPLLHTLNQLFTRTMTLNYQLLNANHDLDIEVKKRTKELQQLNSSLKAMALTDSLTKLGNRRAAVTFLQNEWSKPYDPNCTITCIMIDADKFKHINDTEGHEAGDKVLIIVAQTIRDSVRNDDFVCRLGGDEFVVLANNTNLKFITRLAETIRKNVEGIKLDFSKDSWCGSVSIGIAQRTEKMKDYVALLKKADEGLYSAKEKGRNQVGCTQKL